MSPQDPNGGEHATPPQSEPTPEVPGATTEAVEALAGAMQAWVQANDGEYEVVSHDEGTLIAGVSLPAGLFGARADRISVSINYTA